MNRRTATVYNTNSQGTQVIFNGETTPTTKRYMRLEGYTPAVNDRVLMEHISGTWVILGKVVY